MSRGGNNLDEHGQKRVLMPRAPILLAGFREVLWVNPDGEIEALAAGEARVRAEHEP